MRRTQSILAALLLAAATAASADNSNLRTETPGQALDDTAITTKVKSAFVQDPEVKALDVNVKTYKGTVQLSGFASSQAEIQRAESLARSVPGVTDVQNDIRLRSSPQE